MKQLVVNGFVLDCEFEVVLNGNGLSDLLVTLNDDESVIFIESLPICDNTGIFLNPPNFSIIDGCDIVCGYARRRSRIDHGCSHQFKFFDCSLIPQ